ncbi:hypothetical protein HOLleu_18567 [Holothuria leucospilota]|uniref:Uncharacterized protein n=1 Tax=Holothuria leucospilota TaxID=206669 RepID=A0A9Q1C314_HOLLE|nr:hypothetical protein HOLleu_18567 [Holothuria leucospilota]
MYKTTGTNVRPQCSEPTLVDPAEHFSWGLKTDGPRHGTPSGKLIVQFVQGECAHINIMVRKAGPTGQTSSPQWFSKIRFPLEHSNHWPKTVREVVQGLQEKEVIGKVGIKLSCIC